MSIAIQAENISKAYQIGEFSTGTISKDIERWWALMRGKEDPYLKIGETNDRSTKGESNIVWSLKDINFEINQGDAVGIIGKNGAGKSTLLKILSRVTTPTTGSVKVKGRIASLLEVGTGFHPELTGRENIFLNGAILGMRKHEIKKHFDAIVDFSGVERYIDTPVKRYSSGMYVRLAFAVAAHLESEILIVDEVLAVGDAEFQKKCLGKMGDVSKGEGRTVLFVSHNMDAVQVLCKKAIHISNGTVVGYSNTNKIVSSYLEVESKDLDTSIKNFQINDTITIKEFNVLNALVPYGENLKFFFRICFENRILVYAMALIIYNKKGTRIAVIDLRTLLTNDKTEEISFEGIIKNIQFIPGQYKFGFFINCETFCNDLYDLIEFQVIDMNVKDILPYDSSVLGFVQLKCDLTKK